MKNMNKLYWGFSKTENLKENMFFPEKRKRQKLHYLSFAI